MRNKRKKIDGLNVALGILLVTWILLLLLLIFIFIMRMQGYQNFQEWRDRNQPEVTQGAVPTGSLPGSPTLMPTTTDVPTLTAVPKASLTPTATNTPVPTEANTPVPTEAGTPTPTPTATNTPTPTPIPAFLEALEVSGDAVVDADIRRQAIAFAGDPDTELVYEAYTVGNYFSVVFHKAEETPEGAKEHLLPLVYDMAGQKQVHGSDLMKETFFAIIKERLQTYVAERFPEASEGTDFVTYTEIYQEEDYQQFYLTEEKLVFLFAENSLLPSGQEAFLYETPLEEAKAFFYTRLDGTPNGIAIRELDPDRPMVAFTFDDGPHFQKVFSTDNLDTKLVKLFGKYDGKATFFFVGNRIWEPYKNSYGKIARMVYEAGFEVASHTYSHDTTTVRFYSELASQKPLIWQEFNLTNLAIAHATGYAPDYIRFPGGSVGKWTKELPLPVINWDVDSVDYKEKKKVDGGKVIFDRLKNDEIQDGSIILMHSIYETTYDAVELLLPYLAEQGYQFVTLSELFYYKGMTLKDGVVYKSAVTE